MEPNNGIEHAYLNWRNELKGCCLRSKRKRQKKGAGKSNDKRIREPAVSKMTHERSELTMGRVVRKGTKNKKRLNGQGSLK